MLFMALKQRRPTLDQESVYIITQQSIQFIVFIKIFELYRKFK